MKRHLLLVVGLALLSTSAFATKARMESLGQSGANGSFYLSDTRNVFRNAALVNTTKNYVVTEWGSASATDATATPEAEGGWFSEAGTFGYGVYLNNTQSAQVTHYTSLATTSKNNDVNRTGYAAIGNKLDVFIGADMGFEWGVNVSISSFEDEGVSQAYKKEQSGMGVGFGVIMGDLDAYANVGLKDEAKGGAAAGDKWEATMGINAGANYKLQGFTLFADYKKGGVEETAAGVKTENNATEMTVGAARVMEIASSGRWFYDLRWYNNKSEEKITAGTDEYKVTKIPLTLGFEADATSWLTLRGSISQSLKGSGEMNLAGSAPAATSNNKKTQNANTATVAAGATLNFGKLKVDGVMQTDGSNAYQSVGHLRTDDLMGRVSVHYWF
ncbi:MAG: hypothetical protein A2X86_07240 [Bdellovibrionales bacterium GWA2_49_15]|nr:MAG: hypothetical protein A2X86_07240 [Bdellovibrionales bacterium GWA2_49_15]HAZ11929.1 hypothetical protein [Bdellovibrionales bacterium]